MSDITRKLASIRKIAEIMPIPGADKIELVQVDGWSVVAKKGDFQVGDTCVYFEIDSFLPVRPEFEFLRNGCYREHPDLGLGFRLRTVKMRGQISQGLVLPISILNNFGSLDNESAWVNENGSYPNVEGQDLTDYIGVKKWESPIPAELAGQVRGNFPSFIPKTDQERVQNIHLTRKKKATWVVDGQEFSKEFDDATKLYPEDFTFEVSLKLDGSSMTVYKKGDYVGVCSRNMDLSETETNAYWKCARDSGLIKVMKDEWFDIDFAIQGELMGPGIQGNREGLTKHKFYVFNIYDIRKGKYFTPELARKAIKQLFSYEYKVDIEYVPVYYMAYNGKDLTPEKCLEMAKGPSINNKVREGIVFKANEKEFSFKAINNDFLLEEK
jgi:RNA ligase (TIGR02306 family)